MDQIGNEIDLFSHIS